jgi:hypothetical protein
MRIRNFYGLIGTGASYRSGTTRTGSGPRRPVTPRGRAVMEASRRRTASR